MEDSGVGVGVEMIWCWGVALSCVVLGAGGSVVICACGGVGVGVGPWTMWDICCSNSFVRTVAPCLETSLSVWWVVSLTVKMRVAIIFAFCLVSPTSSSECSQALVKPLVANPCGACFATPPSYGKAKPSAKY
eukprot:4611354-Karenia_brevis.AAC.1